MQYVNRVIINAISFTRTLVPGTVLYRKEDTVSKFYRKADSDEIIWTNILGWWQLNEGAYPTLASLAKKFLAIEATSAASERLFSTTGRLITLDRNQLDPNTVCQILYVKSNLD